MVSTATLLVALGLGTVEGFAQEQLQLLHTQFLEAQEAQELRPGHMPWQISDPHEEDPDRTIDLFFGEVEILQSKCHRTDYILQFHLGFRPKCSVGDFQPSKFRALFFLANWCDSSNGLGGHPFERFSKIHLRLL